MLISFLLVSHDRTEELIIALSSIFRTIARAADGSLTYEIAVLINGGDTEALNSVRRLFAERVSGKTISTGCYYSKLNLGVAGGRNYLFTKSRGDVLVFIDDDAAIVNDKDFIKIVLGEKQNCPNLGILACRSVNPDGSARFNEIPVKRSKEYIKTRAAKFIGVGHVLFRDAVAGQPFLYPESLFYGMEEYYLSIRVINNGFIIIYHPGLVVTHKKSDRGRLRPEDYYINMASNKIYIFRLAGNPGLFYSNFFLWSCWTLYRTGKLKSVLVMWRRLSKLSGATKRAHYINMTRNTMKYLKRYGVFGYYK